MNFFESQQAARRTTARLVGLFILAVAAINLAVWVAVGQSSVVLASKMDATLPFDPWGVSTLATVAAVTLLIVVTGSLYKTAALRAGGPVVARLLGAQPIDPNTPDLKERRLLNVVEEMSIAAGMAVPTVYLLRDEKGINAFAAGLTPTDTVVAVTSGTLSYLTRDELQGVIGHELSHALNGDTRIKLRLMGVLHGILVIGIVGTYLARAADWGGRRSSDRKGDPRIVIVLFGLGLLAIGYIGVFFGRMIKAAVSRQRELLADAASVQFTRNPAGIAGALKKIGGLAVGSKVEHPRAEEASHLFFSAAFDSLMATHPPLVERIRRLEPGFTGELPRLDAEKEKEAVEAGAQADRPRGFGGDFVRTMGAVMAATSPVTPPPPVVEPARVVASVGTLDAAHIEYAEQLIARLPPRLREGVREPMTASAVVFALLLDRDGAVRQRQLQDLGRSLGPALYAETEGVVGLVDACPVEARLPLVDLALPALRRMSAAQFRSFSVAVGRLVAADARMSLFEFTLHRVLVRHLEAHFEPRTAPARAGPRAGAPPAEAVLLSALAHAGHPSPEGAAAAFEAGRRVLGTAALALCPPLACGLSAVGEALGQVAHRPPAARQSLLEACATVVAHDARVTVREGELLRAVADGMDCPLPPFLPGQSLG
jgi:Zn-dependent protease with chaperone function